MKFGMGLNAELTQKYERFKVQNDIRTSKHITSDVLEHKWRASLTTILFLYE